MADNSTIPSLFIGSSSEGLDIAQAIELNLHKDAEVTIWSDGVFGLNQGYLEALVSALDRFDFAVLVVTPDDLVTSRDITTQAPRDNVMFELGLFMGRLGRNRTFALCNDAPDLKLPSDLAGVTLARYSADRADGNLKAATSPACTTIRQHIRELGIAESRSLSRLNSATTQVEGVTETVSNLVNLIARSRILELEVIKNQFGGILPDDFMGKLVDDLRDLQSATDRAETTNSEESASPKF